MRTRYALVFLAALAVGLAGCGAGGSRDVEKLLEALDSGSERSVARATRSLAEHGRAIIKPLSAIITGEDIEELEMSEERAASLRVPAARALGLMAEHASLARTEAENAAKPLLQALTDEDKALRIAAVSALGHFTQLSGPANDIVLLLREDDPDITQAVVGALTNNVLQSIDRVVLPDEPVAAAARTQWAELRERLAGTDDDMRLEAVRELAGVAPERRVPELIRLLSSDKSNDVRYAALRLCLAALDETPDSPFAPKLYETFATAFADDKDSRVLVRTAQTLRERSPELVSKVLSRLDAAREACEAKLLETAGNTGARKFDAATRSDAIFALRNLHGPRRDELLARLVDREKGREPVRIRRAAARVLATAKEPGSASDALPTIATEALRTAMRDPDSIVKLVAAQALGRGGHPEDVKNAVTYLVDLLSHKEAKIRTPAADGLGTLGPKALPDLVTQLDGSLDRTDQFAKHEVPLRELRAKKEPTGEELDKIEQLEEAVAALEAEAEDRDEKHIAWGITSGIGAIAAAVEPEVAVAALDVVLRAARCHYADVRRVAADALGNFRGEEAGSARAIAALMAALADEDPTVRWYATTALERHGPAAVPALTRALANDATAALAAGCLGRIGGPDDLKPLVDRLPSAAGKARGAIVWAVGELLRRHPESPHAAAARAALTAAAGQEPDSEAARLARHALAKTRPKGVRPE